MTTPSLVPTRGYLYVVAAALLWAVSGSAAKFLFQHGMTPYQLVQIRVTLAGGLLFLCLLLRHPALLRVSRGDILYFAVLGIIGMAMVQFTYFFTISKIKVAAAILLQYMAPIFIALHAVVFAREKLTRLTLMAVLGAAAGCYLVVGAYNLDLLALNRAGVISGILAAIAFAFYSIYGERGMCRYSPWTVLLYALAFAALFWNVAHFAWGSAPPPLDSLTHNYSLLEWAWILYIVVFGTILPFGLYFEGISLIRSTRASITATLEPITAGLISYLFLGELLDLLQITGGILVIASVIALQLRKQYDDKTPAIIRLRSKAARPSGMVTPQVPGYGADHHIAD